MTSVRTKTLSLPVIRARNSQVDKLPEVNLTIRDIVKRFPLRVTITDYCNAKCVFCSNDGLGSERKNGQHVDVNGFSYLINLLKDQGLDHVSLSGGDPTLHPKVSRLVSIVNQSGVKKRFFHTNGVLLDREGLLDELSKFTKIGISVHSFDQPTYSQITGLNRTQFQKLLRNLTLLKDWGYGNKVEIKHVPMRGINDSVEDFKRTLEYCTKNGFRFKFLNLEPIEPEHIPLRVDLLIIAKRLREAGAVPVGEDNQFRGQSDYLPITKHKYGEVEGTLIEIGCGLPRSCAACYNSNEICITPGLEIKPCNIHGTLIPLAGAIELMDQEAVLERIVRSRKYLATQPGLNSSYWNARER